MRTAVTLGSALALGIILSLHTVPESTISAQNNVPTEQEYEALMKQARPALQDLKKHLDAQQGAEAAAQATKLVGIFRQAEPFWKARKAEDAIKWANQGTQAALSIEQTAEAKDFQTALGTFKMLQGSCQSCHKVYREELPDKTYRLKKTD